MERANRRSTPLRVARSCRSIDEALGAVAQGGFDAAILDFGLRDHSAAPAARALAAAGIPFSFYTGQVDGDPRLDEWRGRTIVPNPAPPAQIIGELPRLITRSRRGSRRAWQDEPAEAVVANACRGRR